MELDTLHCGDCFELMPQIESKTVDLILCDLPYGTTECAWDTPLDFKTLWKEYRRILKPNGAAILCGIEPFSSKLRLSNLPMYKYDWYWLKTLGSNYLSLKYQPFKKVETLSVFYKVAPVYNPIKIPGKPIAPRAKGPKTSRQSLKIIKTCGKRTTYQNLEGLYYPPNYIQIPNPNNFTTHPTEKPVALMEYMIKTYSNPGALIVDNCMGSGTTAVAAVNLGRHFIGMELDKTYFKTAKKRVAEAQEKWKKNNQ